MTTTRAPERCGRCRSALSSTASFCGGCGTPVAADPPTVPVRTAGSVRGAVVSWVVIAVLALLVVVCLAAVVRPAAFGLRTPGTAAPGAAAAAPGAP